MILKFTFLLFLKKLIKWGEGEGKKEKGVGFEEGERGWGV